MSGYQRFLQYYISAASKLNAGRMLDIDEGSLSLFDHSPSYTVCVGVGVGVDHLIIHFSASVQALVSASTI